MIIAAMLRWTISIGILPSPLGRGCPAAGAFTSRSGTGEGLVVVACKAPCHARKRRSRSVDRIHAKLRHVCATRPSACPNEIVVTRPPLSRHGRRLSIRFFS
jgi:hypothetical protein